MDLLYYNSRSLTRPISKLSMKAGARENTESDCLRKQNSEAEQVSTTRRTWTKQLDFTFSCIGYAIGLANFWRFPYLCMRNGGGAFLIPYFTCLVLCGMPLFFLELSVAQFSGLSPLSLWNVCPLFKGIGWSMVMLSASVTIYYNVIIAWSLYFLVVSCTSRLPWDVACVDDWNTTSSCTNISHWTASNYSFVNYSTAGANASKMTRAEKYWQYDVLQLTSGIHELGSIRWPLLACLFVAWVIVFLCLSKGVKSSGKVVYVTATVPYVLLTLLLVRGVLLPGAVDGILVYLRPNFNLLLSPKVWAEACLQIFYSLGPAWGGLITMASYNRFNNNCLRDSLLVCFVCAGTSFYAGFVCFSILGYLAKESNVAVTDVVTSGPGLAFTVYPEAITKLPISPMWSILFFLTLLTLGLDTQFGMFETCTSGFIDEFPQFLRKRRLLFTTIVSVAFFLLGVPFVTQGGMYLFQIVDWYVGSFSAMLIAFLECVVFAWIYKSDRLYADIEMMLGSKPCIWWRICWNYITPTILMALLTYSAVQMSPPTYGRYRYPSWAIGAGWLVAMCSVVPMPAVAVYRFLCSSAPISTRFRLLIRPTDAWRPNKANNSDTH